VTTTAFGDLVVEESVGGPEAGAQLRRDVLSVFDQLGPRSRQQRFGGPLPELPVPLLDRLSGEADGWSHIVLVARLGERVVGIARLVREDAWSDTAEVAIEVADDFQHQGIGRELLLAVRAIAVERRISTLTADMLAANGDARGLLNAIRRVPGVRDVREEHLGDGRVHAVLRIERAPRTAALVGAP
jgi:GNAT superfamily N-acetyltransferase